MIFNKIIKNPKEVLNLSHDSFNQKSNILLTYINQHCFNIYSSDKIYRNLVDSQFYFFLDGIGIYLALKVLGYPNVQKFNASDINEIIFSNLIERKTKVFIIGGRFSDELKTNFVREKKINLCGYHNGYFDETKTNEIIDNINNSNAQVVIIGLGVPKQEIFASKISNSVKVNLILCVGNFFEFYFGTKKRIPARFRNSGLEWIYRLLSEPGRLWKRYIIGIPLFILRIIKFYLQRKKGAE
jgi:N-acetylglucosaminyldiphosphoundecaprenol N-acetyl-beta-D-mannosaminyltransferase